VEGLLTRLEMEVRQRGICRLWAGFEGTVYRLFLPLKIRLFQGGFLHFASRLRHVDVHHSMELRFGAPEVPLSYFRPLSLSGDYLESKIVT
jgi:hypothetical protein